MAISAPAAFAAAAFQGVYAQQGTLLDRGGAPPPQPQSQPQPQPQPQSQPPSPPRTGQTGGRPEPKLKGQYAKDYEALRASVAKGKPLDEPSTHCLPPGMPRFWNGPYAVEILQTPTQINLFQEFMQQQRRIYLDGRPHPADADPTYFGHSVGHWEGDVLVVDTVNITTEAWLSSSGTRHSDKLHIVERIRRISPTQLEVAMTAEDPEAIAEPYKRTVLLNAKPKLEIGEYVCAENNKEADLNAGGAYGVPKGN